MLKKVFQTVGNKNNQIIHSKRLLTAKVQSNVVEATTIPFGIELYSELKSRIFSSKNNIEKIVVNVEDGQKKKTYLVNKRDSTPLTCAKHISTNKLSNYGLAELSYAGGTVEFVSIHSPFTHECDMKFIGFNSINGDHIKSLNKAYWNSCSVLLSAVLKSGIQLNISNEVVPRTIDQLTFAVDVKGLKSSDIKNQDLIDLSRFAHREFISASKPFEFLEVPEPIAVEYGYSSRMFLCKLGDYVTKVSGPTIAHTGQIGKFAIVGMSDVGDCVRFNGVSVPAAQPVSSYNWNLIMTEASKAC